MMRRISGWRVPLALAAASLLAAFAPRAAMRFERAAIAEGEIWRLVTGHFAHLGPRHLALNLAGLLLVWFLVGGTWGGLQWLFVVAACIAGMDLGFWLLGERLAWYVGLSGLLHGLLAAGIVGRVRGAPVESLALGAVLAGKLAWEQLAGPLPGSAGTVEGPVVVDSHLFGALAGAAAALLLAARAAVHTSTGRKP